MHLLRVRIRRRVLAAPSASGGCCHPGGAVAPAPRRSASMMTLMATVTAAVSDAPDASADQLSCFLMRLFRPLQ